MDSLEKLLDKSENSVYKLVVVASKRALELAEGKPKLTDIAGLATNKPSTIALQEISEGKVTIKHAK